MARRRTGWARIEAIWHLRGATVDRPVKDWLIRESCEGSLIDFYVADIAAETGDLAGALTAAGADDADDAVVDGAGWILVGMCDGMAPSCSMVGFPDAEIVLTAYVRRVLARSPTLSRLFKLAFVDDFLHGGQAEHAPWSDRLPGLRALYRRALSSPYAHQAIAKGLRDPEWADRTKALGEHLGLLDGD
ncbi:hypothetical protein [Spirillospora sp. NPDC047279]|uniref:hypothetical protein n=1 Tax=Spirillospora sp. NPDC047279 TaxID=3155478 RepID=UPI0033CF2CD1